jgi:rod shape determining protein RodA
MAIYGVTIAALLAVLVIGRSVQGAARWFSIGPIEIQPSEFAILALIAAVATYCARREEGLAWPDVFKLLALAAVPMLLVIKQPDLGTAIVMFVVLLVMLAVAGLPARILFILVIGAALVVFAAAKVGILHHYQIQRLTSFLNQDSKSATEQKLVYNTTQSKIAIAAGGFHGTGLGHGGQTSLGYVPEQQTDFIFSAVGEQLGFIGASTVLIMLSVLSWRVLRAAQVARDDFGRLLCAGLFTFVAYSVFQNAGMSMGIMPVTGIPLPFVSYGGSAAICFFAAVGVTISVYRQRSRRYA